MELWEVDKISKIYQQFRMDEKLILDVFSGSDLDKDDDRSIDQRVAAPRAIRPRRTEIERDLCWGAIEGGRPRILVRSEYLAKAIQEAVHAG